MPLNATKCQISEGDLEATTCNQMIQLVSLPICFESSKLYKEREEQPEQISQVPYELVYNELEVSFQVLYDPSLDRLCDGINQLSAPLAGCKAQYQYGGDFPIPRHDSYPKPLYSCLIQLNNCVYMLHDPFV